MIPNEDLIGLFHSTSESMQRSLVKIMLVTSNDTRYDKYRERLLNDNQDNVDSANDK